MTDKRFFCLRGFMKSGTNWVGSLLSSHESISCVGEFHWEKIVTEFNNNLNRFSIYKRQAFREKVRQHFEEMIRRSILERADPTATWIGDRTPHTLVPITLRGVPHISIMRDGRDVLVSRAFHLYNFRSVTTLFDRIPEMAKTLEEFEKDPWYFQKHPHKLLCHEILVRGSVSWWRDHLRSDADAVKRYPHLKVHSLRYEDLHRDTKRERKKLFEFLDVDPSRASKISGDLKAGFKKEQPSKFLRKGAVGDWQNYFTDQTKEWFKEEAGEELIQYGYADSMDW